MVVLPKSMMVFLNVTLALICIAELWVAGSIEVVVLWLVFSLWVGWSMWSVWKVHESYW